MQSVEATDAEVRIGPFVANGQTFVIESTDREILTTLADCLQDLAAPGADGDQGAGVPTFTIGANLAARAAGLPHREPASAQHPWDHQVDVAEGPLGDLVHLVEVGECGAFGEPHSGVIVRALRQVACPVLHTGNCRR